MAGAFSLPNDYWTSIQITPQDVENLHTYLFERETPLTAQDLTTAFIEARIQQERAAAESKRNARAKVFLPKEQYQIGDDLLFSAFEWKTGRVMDMRVGANPTLGTFDVLTVAMENGEQRLFAANLPSHKLNDASITPPEDEALDLDFIVREHGAVIEKKLEAALMSDEGLVRIAGRWFPRALLVDVNQGHLNLAEAVLDMAGGEPLPTESLIKDLELPSGSNPRLAEFSLNLALQEDNRFDEVGPAGQVLWCLRRLEPDFVRDVPTWLRYHEIEHDREDMTTGMMALESQLDDELSPIEPNEENISTVTISLIYPHLRAGTLPMSARARRFFPTAYESPRVRFTLVDGKTKQRIPAWVVREHGYVYGLREWYKAHQLIPGSLVQVRRGEKAGEVIVEAKTQRAAKDWIRTVMVGTDGGMVFAMLKQPITAEFNDRMTIYVPDFKALDPIWEKRQSFEELVISVMRELSKSNPQGHVHAQELYAGINLVRRVPPGPLFALLATRPMFKHVGDLHFRLDEDAA